MGKPVKILYVHRSAGRTYGGALVDLLRVLERIDRQAFEPLVLLSLENCHTGQFRNIGVKTVHFFLPPFRKGKSLPRIPFVIYRLKRFIKEEEINLVHVNDADDAAIVSLASKWAGVPCIVHVRSEMEPKKFRKLWVAQGDKILAVSEAVRLAAIAGGVEGSRVQTSYSGCDLRKVQEESHLFPVRQRLGIPTDVPVIGSVANISPKKGYGYLIEAFSKVVHEIPLFCIIVGADDHGMQKELNDRAGVLGVADRIRFAGFQENVYPFIAAMDIFVLASVDEGFGLVLLEAMALAKPVVATEVHGPPEIVRHGVTGFLVPPSDSSALAEKIALLIRDHSMREKMGAAGRQRVEERFSLEGQVCELRTVYNFLTRQKPMS